MINSYAKKGFCEAIILLSFILFSTSSDCMQPIEQEIVITMDFNLQTIGRFARVCKRFEACSFEKIYNKFPKTSLCCCDLNEDYDRCNRGLIYFFKNNGNRDLCKFLWSFHEKRRKDEIFSFTGHNLDGCQIEACIRLYAEKYKKIQAAKETEREAVLKQKRNKEKETKKVINYEMERNIRKEREASNILRSELNYGVASLLKLHNQKVDIVTLFPRKNDKELLYLCCKNASNGRELSLIANIYVTQYPSVTMNYLFEFNKFTVMYDLVVNGPLTLNTQSTCGKTLLHYLNYKCGCQSDWLFSGRCSDPQSMLEDLLRLGADVNVIDNKGMTVLHYACKYLHVNTVKKLLTIKNIDSKKKNKKNKRPIDYVDYLWDSRGSNVKQDRKFIKILLESHMPETS